jgi:hypothetical protein
VSRSHYSEGRYPPFKDYIPVQKQLGNEPRASVARQNLAMLSGLHSEFPGEVEEGLLEQTCWKMFKVRLVRGVLRNPEALDEDEMDEFVGWVEASTLEADALPLSLSQRLYNYARVQSFTASGREGFRIPKKEKRRSYASVAFQFLSFCEARGGEAWAEQEDFSQCWQRLLNTETLREQSHHISLIGLFVQEKLEGIFLFNRL